MNINNIKIFSGFCACAMYLSMHNEMSEHSESSTKTVQSPTISVNASRKIGNKRIAKSERSTASSSSDAYIPSAVESAHITKATADFADSKNMLPISIDGLAGPLGNTELPEDMDLSDVKQAVLNFLNTLGPKGLDSLAGFKLLYGTDQITPFTPGLLSSLYDGEKPIKFTAVKITKDSVEILYEKLVELDIRVANLLREQQTLDDLRWFLSKPARKCKYIRLRFDKIPRDIPTNGTPYINIHFNNHTPNPEIRAKHVLSILEHFVPIIYTRPRLDHPDVVRDMYKTLDRFTHFRFEYNSLNDFRRTGREDVIGLEVNYNSGINAVFTPNHNYDDRARGTRDFLTRVCLNISISHEECKLLEMRINPSTIHEILSEKDRHFDEMVRIAARYRGCL